MLLFPSVLVNRYLLPVLYTTSGIMDTLAADREKLKEIRALLKATDISDKGKIDCLGEFVVGTRYPVPRYPLLLGIV